MQQRKQIKAVYLWLVFLITLVLGVLLVLWTSRSEKNTLPMALMVLDFVIMTMAINSAIARTFRYKAKPRKCAVNKYEGLTSNELDKKLVSLGFNRKGVRFGHGYIKIEGKTAYKVVGIDDYSKYFTNNDTIANETKNEEPTKGIDQCDKFIGFEIFYTVDDSTKEKILDFAFQGDKIYYDGFYFDESTNLFVEPNYIAPKGSHIEEYNKLIEMIDFKKVNNEQEKK